MLLTLLVFCFSLQRFPWRLFYPKSICVFAILEFFLRILDVEDTKIETQKIVMIEEKNEDEKSHH